MNTSGQYAVNGPAPREPTLNERLNRLCERLQSSCNRIESVLDRVNGTASPAPEGHKDIAQISPTLPLGTVVEHLESVQARLMELASSAERIA